MRSSAGRVEVLQSFMHVKKRHRVLRLNAGFIRWAAPLLGLALAGTAWSAPRTKIVPPPAANVVRPAPEVAWVGAGGRTFPLKTFRGQPIVILVAPSPDAGPLRKEAGRIEDLYLQFAAKKVVFITAFTQATGRVRSDVPFVVAANGAAVATAYGVPPNGLSIIVISADGNVDMVSNKAEGAQRILDVINNTFQVQAAARTDIGS